ncbi:molybdopterin-dependent oxidoreductase [Alcanivorax hongdengensis]|uniref:molybdopterin-dependent oxidoreductase n=1 Tax=Alcanivorax hongdengensis TaxID=519051 RepID=UPI0003001CB9|nr:molybdopterin-dependent oxidoreductase [Alcanivorax hongdengensis]
MKSVPTFCRVCEPSCALVAQVDDGKVQRLQPDRDHPVTRGFACHKGINYLAIHQDPDRLDTPLARQGDRRPGQGQWQPRSWESVTDDIAGALKQIIETHGPDAVAGYIGNPTAFNALGSQAIGEFFMGLGSRRIFNPAPKTAPTSLPPGRRYSAPAPCIHCRISTTPTAC